MWQLGRLAGRQAFDAVSEGRHRPHHHHVPIHLAVAHSTATRRPLERRRGESDRGPPARAHNANVFSRCHSYLELIPPIVATSAPEIYFPSRPAIATSEATTTLQLVPHLNLAVSHYVIPCYTYHLGGTERPAIRQSATVAAAAAAAAGEASIPDSIHLNYKLKELTHAARDDGRTVPPLKKHAPSTSYKVTHSLWPSVSGKLGQI